MELLGLTIPEEYGGVGQTILETVVVGEELGRSLLPSPYFVSSVLGAGADPAAGRSEEQRREWLPRSRRGEAIVSVAWQEPERSASGRRGSRCAPTAGALSGEKIMVPFASAATGCSCSRFRRDAGVGLFLVDPPVPASRSAGPRRSARDRLHGHVRRRRPQSRSAQDPAPVGRRSRRS